MVDLEMKKGMDFQQWAMGKYRDIMKRIKIADDEGLVTPDRLNSCLINFTSDYAWFVTMEEIEVNRYYKLQHDYEMWHRKKFADCTRMLKEEVGGTGRQPSQAAVDARVAVEYGDEMHKLLVDVGDAKSRAGLMRNMGKVLEKQGGMLQTLSSNMRSELFFSTDLTVKTIEPDTEETKRVIKEAMRPKSLA